MLDRKSIAAIALMALSLTVAGAPTGAIAHDESKYPGWSGQWLRAPDGGPPRYDTTTPFRVPVRTKRDTHPVRGHDVVASPHLHGRARLAEGPEDARTYLRRLFTR